MTQRSTFLRKCSPTVAAVAGAAVCLSNQGALAAVHTGNISASNGGAQTFSGLGGGTTYMNIFGNNASVKFYNFAGTLLVWSASGNTPKINHSVTYIKFNNAGVDINSGIAGGFAYTAYNDGGFSNKYLAVRFNSGGIKFGWIHVVNTTITSMVLDLWGYDDTGASIKTLSDSILTRTLKLSSGMKQLTWTNKNEDGVSRYEVQAKDDKGEWQAVDSDVPGEGRYNVRADSDGDYRLVVEKIDGTTEEVAF